MTELTWDGKYKDGKKVAPVRIALPFQTIETVNESEADRQKTLDIFAQNNKNSEWRNRLIWGDKKYVLPSLLPELAGKVNLIYIDPPFDTGANFSFTATIADAPKDSNNNTEGEVSFTKQPNIIEQKAYRDTWGRGLDSYLQWFYETALLLRELLAENGSIYVHLDWHVGHYAKAVLDEVFGYENFRNEIIWHYSGWNKKLKSSFEKRHDVIMLYTKGTNSNFNSFFEKWESKEDYVKKRKQKVLIDEESNKEYVLSDGGNGTRVKRFLDEAIEEGVVLDDVWNLDKLNNSANASVNYPTQKPEALLERIIKASSNEGDLVLDCFCGSGTTAATAEKLNRRWITCDLGRFAVHTARKRFLGIEKVKPFVVQNLGKYERQAWMKAEFSPLTPEGGTDENVQKRLNQERAYRSFILELYFANPLEGYVWLHGNKAGRLVHIGSVDAPITVDDIKATIKEFWKLTASPLSTGEGQGMRFGIDFIGWDFAFDVNETAIQFAKENKVSIACKKIPREVLEKKAIEQGDIKFYELASLTLNSELLEKQKVKISLENFIIPPDDVPEEIRGKITHWSQWIDYWAIDWNYRDDTFHNEWQSYRTKQKTNLDLSAEVIYKQAGQKTILVKVIDILGNDTTKMLTLKI